MKARREILRLGVKGQRLVVVYALPGGRFLVDRFTNGFRKRKQLGERAAAIRWAETWYRAGERASVNLTLRELFDRYLATMQTLKTWRGSTVSNYANHRKRIEEALGPDSLANELTLGALDTLWTSLAKLGMAPNQIRQKVKLLQRAFAWSYARELVTHNKLAQWEEMPEVVPQRVAEYGPAEVERLLRAFDKDDGWEWRPWALVMVMQCHGIRINALLHLRWEDVDLAGQRLILRAEHDKTKRSWDRPLHWDAYAAFRTARWHADRLDKTSPWVFYGMGEKPFTYQAFHMALQKAERRAGVDHVKWRGAHGLRRYAVNQRRQETGDAALAMLWVGDTDMKAAQSYVRPREAELTSIAERGATKA